MNMATMSSREKADTLQRELIEQGYKANVQVVRSGERRLYRVTIGPKFDKAAADSIKRAVDKRYRVESIIARYRP